ncbi:MAG: monovalent cation/H+ antiporter complex subunit F [Chloroflexota bacterium]
MTLFEWGMEILLVLLSISLIICFVRLYRGPDVPDRTVAFDLISTHAVGLFALFALRNRSVVLLDGAIVTAVLGFLGTLMLARYLERRQS